MSDHELRQHAASLLTVFAFAVEMHVPEPATMQCGTTDRTINPLANAKRQARQVLFGPGSSAGQQASLPRAEVFAAIPFDGHTRLEKGERHDRAPGHTRVRAADR